MAVLDAGLTATLSREFALVDNSLEEKIKIFKTLESSYFIIVGLSIILLFALSGIISNKWLNLNAFDSNKVSFFLKIISFDVGFQLLFRFYMGGLLGLEKQVKANIYQVGWGIIRNGVVVLVIIFLPQLNIFFLWQALSTVIFTIFLRLSLNKTLKGKYSFDFQPKIEREVFRRIWRFASGMLLISLVACLNTQMDKLAISKLLPIETLGYYTLAVSLALGMIVLVNPISIALLPRMTSLYSSGNKDEASKLFHKVSLFVAILVFSLMANMDFFAKELIWVWTGKMELAEHAHLIIPVISFAYTMLSLSIIPFNIAVANGYTKLNNLLGLISLFVTLPGYWIATRHFGAIGAAYVFCGVQIMVTLVYLYIINKKFIKIRIETIYIKQILLPLIITLSFAFGFSLVLNGEGNSRIVSLIRIGASTLVTFFAAILILVPFCDLKKIIKI